MLGTSKNLNGMGVRCPVAQEMITGYLEKPASLAFRGTLRGLSIGERVINQRLTLQLIVSLPPNPHPVEVFRGTLRGLSIGERVINQRLTLQLIVSLPPNPHPVEVFRGALQHSCSDGLSAPLPAVAQGVKQIMEQDWFHTIGSHSESVQEQWIDYNGHMNLAYYVLVFDHASDVFLDAIEAGKAYRNATDASVFVLEMHVNYIREVRVAEQLQVSTQLLDHDHKRVHLFHRMLRQSDNCPVATNELMLMHVRLADLRSIQWPKAVAQRIAIVADRQGVCQWPQQAGSRIGIKRS